MSNLLHPYERAKATIYYSIALGLSPVYISKREKEPELIADLKLHLISFLYLMTYVLLLIAMIGSSEVVQVTRMNNEAYMDLVIINNGLRVITCVVLNLSCFVSRNKIKLVFENLAEVDIALRKFKIKRYYKKEVLVQIIHLFFEPLLYIGIAMLQYWNAPRENASRPSVPSLIAAIYSNLLVSVADTQHTLLALATKRNFFDVNTCLRKGIEKPTNENNKNHNYLALEEIKLLMCFHDKLCDIVSLMNSGFGAHLMVLTPYQLGYMLVYLFHVYEALTSSKPLESFCALMLVAVVFFQILRRLIVCHLTCNELHKTKELVQKVLLLERSDRLIKELIIFSRQLLHVNTLRLHVAAVCPLDLTILYWGIAFTASMLIVFYQSSPSSTTVTCV